MASEIKTEDLETSVGGFNYDIELTFIEEFYSTNDWGKGAIIECNKWLKYKQLYHVIKIWKSNNPIKNIGGLNSIAKKTKIQIFYSSADWGKGAKQKCNQFLTKGGDKYDHKLLDTQFITKLHSSEQCNLCHWIYIIYVKVE